MSNENLPEIFSLLKTNTKVDGILYAVKELSVIGPDKYKPNFERIHARMLDSTLFSEAAADERLFDDITLTILRASENQGKLESAFEKLYKISKFQRASSKLIKRPVQFNSILLSLLTVMILFQSETAFLAIGANESTRSAAMSFFFNLGTFVKANPWAYIAAPLTVFMLLQYAIRSKSIGEFFLNIGSLIPALSKTRESYELGLWCNFTSLLASTGLDILSNSKSLTNIVSEKYRNGITQFFNDLERGATGSDAAKSENWGDEDPRESLPPLFLSYLSTAASTGDWEEPIRELGDTYIEEYKDSSEPAREAMNYLMTLIVAAPLLFVVVTLIGGANSAGGN